MITTVDPATGLELARYDHDDPARVIAVLDQAAATARRWAEVDIADRAAALVALAARLEADLDDHARLITSEMGKPIAQARAEVAKCARSLRWIAEHGPTHLTPEPRPGTDADWAGVRFDPLGVVLAVMPWNFPYWQVVRFAGPALLAGNVGLVKHAEATTGSNLALAQAAVDAGLPVGAWQTLVVGHDAIAEVVADDRVAAVTLTGSERAGRSIAAAAGAALKPCVLELGGSDPFVVLDDADLDAAVATAVTARMQNTGQSCIAAKRFIVTAGVAEEFVDRFSRAVADQRVGDPSQDETEVGPMARADLRDELAAQVDDSVAAGAVVRTGGRVRAGPGWFYEPTVLDHVRPEHRVGVEEVFGPVAAVLRAGDVEEALSLANATRFGLGASIWTADPSVAASLERGIRAGSVFVNAMVRSDPAVPFGGVGVSGFGRELGVEGLRAFTNVKTVWRA